MPPTSALVRLYPAADAAPRTRHGDADRAQCCTCNLRDLCLPRGLDGAGVAAFSEMVSARKRVKRSETLYRTGEAFDAIYAVRSGFFKSRVIFDDGRDQVTGFHMAGEIVGMDGIGTERHTTDVIALEDSEVCVIPYARLDEPGMQRQLHKAMSRELVRDQGVMMLLGTMRAEERIATFLLSLSQRHAARGFSASEFHLRMTRDEIGSYLGLSLETVSRLLSRFQSDNLITVHQKHIRILDVPGLRAMMASDPD
jgi:CRP/FNR family transcriptional regulator